MDLSTMSSIPLKDIIAEAKLAHPEVAPKTEPGPISTKKLQMTSRDINHIRALLGKILSKTPRLEEKALERCTHHIYAILSHLELLEKIWDENAKKSKKKE
jgi:hypothetical protein